MLTEAKLYFDTNSLDDNNMTPLQVALNGKDNETMVMLFLKSLEFDFYTPYKNSTQHPLIMALRNKNL